MILYWILGVLGIVGAGICIWKRCFSNTAYVLVMFIQCVAYAHTRWIILCFAVLVTVAALLLTENNKS